MSIDEIRERYSRAGLSETDLNADPILQFEQWSRNATDAGVFEPGAACLATASRQGEPSARMVLLKGVEEPRVHLLHQLRQPQGTGLDREPSRRPGGGLGGAGASGAHCRKRRTNLQGGIGPLFREPACRQPAQRLGLSPERGDRKPPGAGRAGAKVSSPIRRRRHSPASLLGRVLPLPRPD